MKRFKRMLDVALSGIGLMVLSPILAAIALAIVGDSRGPVFFRQIRVGRHGRSFHIFKFRTMRANTAGVGRELTTRDDDRITRVGHVLRHYKLDELPQLLNVLRGDMSLVGPRPEVPRYVAKWDDGTRRIVLSVRPGMTDLASIAYRHESGLLNESNDPERTYVEIIAPAKNALAIHYIENWSLWLDIQILFRTFAAILR